MNIFNLIDRIAKERPTIEPMIDGNSCPMYFADKNEGIKKRSPDHTAKGIISINSFFLFCLSLVMIHIIKIGTKTPTKLKIEA